VTVSDGDIDLARLVRETAAGFDRVAGVRAIAYDVSTPDTARARVYPDKLQRIVTILLLNAFRVTPEGGRVRCELLDHQEGGQPAIELRVSDTGRPAPPDGNTEQRLAIVRECVDLHRGRVTVEETPGGGATFVVRLPRSSSAAPSPASVASQQSATRPTIATVLVVGDDPEVNQFVADALRHRYRVLTANNAAAALTIVASEKPDLIISDAAMPGTSGISLLEWLRGAQVHLTKAVLIEELRARVATLVAIKKTRDILQDGIASAEQDLAALARTHVLGERALGSDRLD
jgi:CheY-like chemotaxis protein